MTEIWNAVAPLLMGAIVVTIVVCLTKLWWLRMDGNRTAREQMLAHAKRCASCSAGVYHSQHDGTE